MYHSVTFGNKNSWTNWHLVPTIRPVINPPTVKTRYVEIPGANGSIDLTDSLTGEPFYNDREGSIEFYVLNQYDIFGPLTYNWADLLSNIMAYLHGKSRKLYLEDDPDYYYEGRFSVESWKTDADRSTITIGYHLSPFKYPVKPPYVRTEIRFSAFEVTQNPLTIRDVPANTSFTLDNPRAYVKGDAIKFGDYRYNLALFSDNGGNNAKAYYPYSQISNGEFSFTDNGYYRFMMYKAGSPILTESEAEDMISTVKFLPKGVL